MFSSKLHMYALLILQFLLAAAVTPVAPTEDPFYTPPAGYESAYKVGDIIAHRPVPGTLASILVPQNVHSSWQFLVRSEDSHGNANAIVTTLIVPYNADPNKLLSYQVAQDTVFVNCAPSYNMQLSNKTTTPAEMSFIISALDNGWYVVVPDYEGPQSAFVAGYLEGKATIDSIRAVLKSGSYTGLGSKPKISLWGYSGGTVPTGWAVNLAPTYAPELTFVGAAIGGIVANVTAVVENLSGTLFAGFAMIGIVGLSTEFPELKAVVDEEISSSNSWRFDYLKTVCLNDVLLSQAFFNIWGAAKDGHNVMYNPVLQSVVQKHNMVQDAYLPKTPLFFYHSVQDEIVPIKPVDYLYDNWCSRGVSINYQVDMTGEHVTEAVFGAGKALVWLEDRMNGVPQKGCTKSVNLSNVLDLRGIIALGGVVIDSVKAFLQIPVGLGDKINQFSLVG